MKFFLLFAAVAPLLSVASPVESSETALNVKKFAESIAQASEVGHGYASGMHPLIKAAQFTEASFQIYRSVKQMPAIAPRLQLP